VQIGALMMELTVNGEPRRLGASATVKSLIDELGLDSRKVAVERNREIVPKSRYSDTVLAEGDALEIVCFVGGG
jgi:thiamine biosynthesis protein ThiS